MTRALGIDFGKARIGLAITDEIGLMAHPLETVPAQDLGEAADRIVAVVVEKKVDTIVVGLPLHMNGEEGKAVESVRNFTNRFRKKLPDGIEIVEVDERLSTVSAMTKLHAAGRNAKNAKSIIDMASAVEILQDWLDLQDGGNLLPNPFPEDEF